MKRRLKIAAAVAGIIFLGFLAASLLIARFFPYQKVRALMITEAQNRLHRQVQVGPLSWGIFKGLTVQNFELSESPDFSKGVFAKFSSASLRLSWRALLKRKIVFSAMTVSDLTLKIKKNRNGLYNFSNLLSSAPVKETIPSNQPKKKYFASTFKINEIIIKNGNILYQDRATQNAINLSQIQLTSTGLRIGRPFALALDFTAHGTLDKQAIDGNFSYQGDLNIPDLTSRKFSAHFTKLAAQNGKWAVVAQGQIKTGPSIKTKIHCVFFNSGQKLLALQWDGSAQGPWSLDKTEIRGNISLKTPALKGKETPFSKIPQDFKLPPLSAQGTIHLKNGIFSSPKLTLNFPFGAAHLSGQISDIPSKNPKPDLAADLFLQTTALKSSDFPEWKLPQGLRIPPMNIAAQTLFKGRRLTLQSLAIQAKAGTLNISGTIDHLLSPHPIPALTIKGNLHFPSTRSEEIAWARLSKGLVIPALGVQGEIDIDNRTLLLSPLTLHTDLGSLDLSGPIDEFESPKPQPHLTVSAAINLPAFHSSDIPMKLLPKGIHFPSSRWDGHFSLSRDQVKIQKLALAFERNKIEFLKSDFTGLSGKNPSLKILVKCPAFDLPEITPIFEATRKFQITGNGFFALAALGPIEHPTLGGKLKFQNLGTKGLGFDASGLSGIVSFDDHRIDAPKISGKLNGSPIDIDITIKNYTHRPFIDVQADLADFDLAQFFIARDKMQALAPSATSNASDEHAEKRKFPIDAKGRLSIQHLAHPKFKADDVRITWNVTGIGPDIRELGGHAEVSAAHGNLKDIGNMADKSVLVKVLISPIIVIQKITSLGGIKLFPNFNNISFRELSGKYSFLNGIMSIDDSHIYSDAANVNAKGNINIPSQNIDMKVTAQIANIAPVNISVKGNIDKPKIHVNLAELLLGPAQDLLKDVLGK